MLYNKQNYKQSRIVNEVGYKYWNKGWTMVLKHSSVSYFGIEI